MARPLLAILALLLGESLAFLPTPRLKRTPGLEIVVRPASGKKQPLQMAPLMSTVIDGPSEMEPQVAEAEVETASTTRVGESGPASVADYKEELIELVGNGMFGASSARKRAQINEVLLRLEATNPTAAPSYSALLNGPWKFIYTGGISPGMLVLQLVGLLSSSASGAIELGDTQLTISRAQPRAEVQTTVRVFGRDQSFKIRTRLDVETDRCLKETLVEGEAASLKLPFPEAGFFERRLLISYLDDDLLVVRDSFGAPDILVRKSKAFTDPSYGVPSAHDGDSAPGAG